MYFVFCVFLNPINCVARIIFFIFSFILSRIFLLLVYLVHKEVSGFFYYIRFI